MIQDVSNMGAGGSGGEEKDEVVLASFARQLEQQALQADPGNYATMTSHGVSASAMKNLRATLIDDGVISKDWPAVSVTTSGTKGVFNVSDAPTAILMAAIARADDDHPLQDLLPYEYTDIRDGIWEIHGDVVCVWSEGEKQLFICAGAAGRKMKALRARLKIGAPPLSGSEAVRMAGTLATLYRAFPQSLEFDGARALMSKTVELSDAKDGEFTAACMTAVRFSLHSLLALAPSCVVTRVIVSCSIEGVPHINAYMILGYPKEVNVATKVALILEGELLEKAEHVVIITDKDACFTPFETQRAWERIPASDWKLTPKAKERIAEWSAATPKQGDE